jgi:hypothetical protein
MYLVIYSTLKIWKTKDMGQTILVTYVTNLVETNL